MNILNFVVHYFKSRALEKERINRDSLRNCIECIGLFAVCLMVIITLNSCDKDEFITSDQATITFSNDTLRFDTVFTDRGSATRSFKIYNPHDKAIRISKVEMENPSGFFRFNVDGFSEGELGEVVVWPKDSTYVFVEVTIDPDQAVSVSPFIISDKMWFTVNGNSEFVVLEAFGQNANYIPANNAVGGIVLLSCSNGTITWDDAKPYVIFGVLVIDDCTLIWPKGSRIHVHGGVARDEDQVYNDGLIFTGPEGRIISEGTVDQPVVVQGSRLESGFAEVAGQWSGIRLGERSGPHQFSHTVVKNSILGIRSDSASVVHLDNVKILNTAGPGLVGIHNTIRATNCLIANNGGHSVQLSYGGDHKFYYTTMANYGNQLEALRMDNAFCYDPPECNNVGFNPIRAEFVNSIIGGSGRDELRVVDFTGGEPGFMDFTFDHCLVRVFDLLRENSYPNFMDECNNCLNYQLFEPLFLDLSNGDYRLDSLSIATGLANPIPNITTVDINENPRHTSAPDVGCFESEFK